eukprot:COSAG01_NODE_29080_length_646_cov_0.561243_1_plen_61_part_10
MAARHTRIHPRSAVGPQVHRCFRAAAYVEPEVTVRNVVVEAGAGVGQATFDQRSTDKVSSA